MSYTQKEAEALAAKREAHKPKHMMLKSWKAIEQPNGSWVVKLVDSAAAQRQSTLAKRAEDQELMKAAFEAALITRDRNLLVQIGDENHRQKMKNVLDDLESEMRPEETEKEAFARLWDEHEDTVMEAALKRLEFLISQ